MSGKRRVKLEGWVGIVDGKPFVEKASDNYCEIGESVLYVQVYRSRKQARKRFDKVALVSAAVSQ